MCRLFSRTICLAATWEGGGRGARVDMRRHEGRVGVWTAEGCGNGEKQKCAFQRPCWLGLALTDRVEEMTGCWSMA